MTFDFNQGGLMTWYPPIPHLSKSEQLCVVDLGAPAVASDFRHTVAGVNHDS